MKVVWTSAFVDVAAIAAATTLYILDHAVAGSFTLVIPFFSGPLVVTDHEGGRTP